MMEEEERGQTDKNRDIPVFYLTDLGACLQTLARKDTSVWTIAHTSTTVELERYLSQFKLAVSAFILS